MNIFTRQRRTLIFAAMLALRVGFASCVFAQEAQPDISAPAASESPKIAVYLTGDAPDDKKKTIGTRLLVALVKTGRYGSIDRPAEFAAVADSARAAQQSAMTVESCVYSVAAEFGAGFVCMTDVAVLAEEYQIFARVIDTKTARAVAIGDFYGPIKTAAELKEALDELVETMFPTPKEAPPVAAPQAQIPAADASTADAPVAAVPVTGEAAEVEDGGGADTRFYFTPKYQSPVGSPVSWGGVNAEIGWVWRSGLLLGIDVGFGMDGAGLLAGGGLSVGKEYDFKNQMQIVYGGTAGFWYLDHGYRDSYNFLAPFVKYRWNTYEVTYRGLMGITYGGKFGYNSHQTMVGYYMATKGSGHKEKNARFYFAPKYQTPVGTPSSWGGVNAEFGWVWRNGFLLGIDFNYGDTDDYYTDGSKSLRGGLVGGGLGLGKVCDLGSQIQIAFGGTVGFWKVESEGFNLQSLRFEENESYNFLAPFVKLRVNVFEITYRGLLGIYKSREIDFAFSSKRKDGSPDFKETNDNGFGYNSQQLMVGFNIGGLKNR